MEKRKLGFLNDYVAFFGIEFVLGAEEADCLHEADQTILLKAIATTNSVKYDSDKTIYMRRKTIYNDDITDLITPHLHLPMKEMASGKN